MLVKLPILLLGAPLKPIRIRPRGGNASSNTACYLFFETQGFSRKLQYVPNGNSNDGTIVTIDGSTYWEFSKPAEWNRDLENLGLKPGDYEVLYWIGPLTGLTGIAKEFATMKVKMPASGSPLS